MRPPNEPGIPAWCGEALRLRRLIAGYTAMSLAEEIGVAPSTIGRWEADENSPSAEHVKQLAAVLDVKPRAFSRVPKIR